MPVFIERDKKNQFIIEFQDRIDPKNYNDKIELTKKLNDTLEKMIIRNPVSGYGHITGGNKNYFF